MKLSFIEVCGFRGFRKLTRVDIPTGFAIFTGRNGVGKSTMCDAVEFALTGALSRYTIDDSSNDAAVAAAAPYIWWLGDEPAERQYVAIGFIDDSGNETTVTRSRDAKLEVSSGILLHTLLCDSTQAPESAIEQLCRTSIIRDEMIARMSLEMKDVDRFKFVSSALGSVSAGSYTERSHELLRLAKIDEEATRKVYERLRERVSESIEELSRARDAASNAINVDQALIDLRSSLDINVSAEHDMTYLAQQIAEHRSRFERLHLLSNDLKLALGQLEPYLSDNAATKTADLKKNLSVNLTAITQLCELITETEKKLELEQKADSMAGALTSFIRAGISVGPVDGHCPLCDTALSAAQFSEGVKNAHERLSRFSHSVTTLQEHLDDAGRQLKLRESQKIITQNELDQLVAGRRNLEERIAALKEDCQRSGLSVDLSDMSAVGEGIDSQSDRLAVAERSLRLLQLARSSSAVLDMETHLAVLRTQLAESEKKRSRSLRALQLAKETDEIVRRSAHEVIEDRLSSISPLLSELFERLRPHSDWHEIHYNLRGDLRRFLSLTVGDNLNPQYVFSSGQRRAAGIAFLLAVYLSRTWSNWNTLVLDDPVQHIDDYRSLNLVELLAATRRNGRQIICAVEDEALADLLTRRLRSTTDSPGTRFDFMLASDGSPVIAGGSAIQPLLRDSLAATLKRDVAASE